MYKIYYSRKVLALLNDHPLYLRAFKISCSAELSMKKKVLESRVMIVPFASQEYTTAMTIASSIKWVCPLPVMKFATTVSPHPETRFII